MTEGNGLQPADLSGWSPPAETYERYLEDADAVTVVEIGDWKGKSSSFIAKWLQKKGRGVLVAIDTWLGAPEFWTKRAMADGERSLQLLHGWPTIYWQFLSNMIHEELQGVVVPLPQPSKLANVLLRRLKVTAIDFMHIDAAHDCKENVHVWWPLLRHGGILMGDDYHAPFPGVMKAANEFVLMCELEEFFNVDGKKWIVHKPPSLWYAARPQLPAFCLNGDTEHMIGALAWE